MPTAPRQCDRVWQEFLFWQRPPPGQVSPSRQPSIVGVPLPTDPMQCGSAMHELHCPLPLDIEVLHAWQRIAGVPFLAATASWAGFPVPPAGGTAHRSSSTPAIHCLGAWGQWAVQLLSCTAKLPGGGGQCNSCNARDQQLGGRGVLSRRRSMLKNEILQCTATLPRGSEQCNSCNTRPHCLGALGSATRA